MKLDNLIQINIFKIQIGIECHLYWLSLFIFSSYVFYTIIIIRVYALILIVAPTATNAITPM